MSAGFNLLYLAMFIFVGTVIWSQVSFTLLCNVYICWVCGYVKRFLYTLPCNVYTCWVCNMITGFIYSTLQCLHLYGLTYVYKFSFTLPCNVYICWVCNMFTSFHLLYLAMFTLVGSVICLQMFIYSNFQCLWL